MYNHVHRALGKREISSKETEYRRELYVHIYTHTHSGTLRQPQSILAHATVIVIIYCGATLECIM